MSRAMYLSLAVGFLMLALKVGGYLYTGSAAILSDAAESVVHVAAVAFATYSLRLSFKPPDKDHLYGHAKISYFSAGFEGAMIIVAAVYILYEAILDIVHGPQIENPGIGAWLTGLAVLINAALGAYLVILGKRKRSVILEANGKHVLTDVWTSAGVLVALFLTLQTHWLYWDPITAIILALNIVWSGWGLLHRSFGGLMDRTDPEMDKRLRETLESVTTRCGIKYHQLRHRHLGNAWWVDLHLLFPSGMAIEDAHDRATDIEDALEQVIPGRAYVTTHLEPIEGHDARHRDSHFPHRG